MPSSTTHPTPPPRWRDEIQRFLPMNPVEFLVLAALAENELHGYGLVRDIAERTDGRVRLRPGNLYRVLDRLASRQLIEECERRPVAAGEAGSSHQEKRRFYRISELGRRVAAAEADLLKSVMAKSKGLRLKEAS